MRLKKNNTKNHAPPNFGSFFIFPLLVSLPAVMLSDFSLWLRNRNVLFHKLKDIFMSSLDFYSWGFNKIQTIMELLWNKILRIEEDLFLSAAFQRDAETFTEETFLQSSVLDTRPQSVSCRCSRNVSWHCYNLQASPKVCVRDCCIYTYRFHENNVLNTVRFVSMHL